MAPDVDVETLRLLADVAELGSLSAAAERRGVSQVAVSARVREFEARWRLSVLHRSPRGSVLTTDGEAVLSWAREVLHAVETMRASLGALSAQRHAGMAVAASLTVAEQLVPRWLGELHIRMPDVRPVLKVVNSDTVAALLRSGAADIGFIESADLPPGLSRRTVGSDRLLVIVAPGHPWARRRTPVEPAELRAASWVLREAGSGTRSTFERALQHQPELAMEATSTTALVGAALAGVGPAVVSARSVKAEVHAGRLVAVPTSLDLLRPLTCLWRGEERMAEAAAELLRIALEASEK